MWSVNVPDLLVRIHNSLGIWAHQPSLDTEHWTVGNTTQIMHSANYSHINNSYRKAWEILSNWYYHSSNMATWITQKQIQIHKNQPWISCEHSLWCNAALTHTVTNNGEFIPLQSWGSKFHRSSTWLRILSHLKSQFLPENEWCSKNGTTEFEHTGIIYINTAHSLYNTYDTIYFIIINDKNIFLILICNITHRRWPCVHPSHNKEKSVELQEDDVKTDRDLPGLLPHICTLKKSKCVTEKVWKIISDSPGQSERETAT